MAVSPSMTDDDVPAGHSTRTAPEAQGASTGRRARRPQADASAPARAVTAPRPRAGTADGPGDDGSVATVTGPFARTAGDAVAGGGEYAGRVAFVTGSGSGIGAACARRLAAAGAFVVLADRDTVAAKEVAGEIEAAGGTALAVAVDVADPESVAQAVATAIEAGGRLDLAVNNAGIATDRAPLEDISLADWDRVLAVNLSGVFYSMRAEIPAMLAAGGGSIVNMASVLGTVGLQGTPAYVAAKHGVIGLTRVAALDNATRGIRVNAVAPGFIDTTMVSSHRGARFFQPMNRLGTAAEVAEVVHFLLSDRASLVTGSVYSADGGFTAR
nr:SDR family NAD(P)-dependent oxidoreductase [Parafrankia sp. Ea1.12]